MERERGTGGMEAGELGDVADALRELGDEARESVARLADELELERRMAESPMVVLGVAAAAGLVLGGGLWPLLRPMVRMAARAALSPTNLLALGAAVGAMRAARAREATSGAGPEGSSVPSTH
ncbi:hypothetical protein [Anaeromyxobacter dehalogenans]|uniref:Uncharacterized protein n=1 Tax=Anaeromyxobacter dehalogenans (strain 2CP-C) TaxID=290397 RepID=Q2IKH5_ANADE|nr:hypothetical protein [Anaeromyxobacter dehalogenans]ABC82152.1 hypothetical protein Adeh_2382 [Anaeromyxobacter dehalogenans 2CP-C]